MGLLDKLVKHFFTGPNEDRETKKGEAHLDKGLRITSAMIQNIFAASKDLVVRSINAGEQEISLIYLLTTVDLERIASEIILPITLAANLDNFINSASSSVACADILECDTLGMVVDKLLDGYVILLAGNEANVTALKVESFAKRNAHTPDDVTIVRGPKDGFDDDLHTNLSLIRKRLRDPNLAIETFIIGRRTRTRTALLYIKGLTSDGLVDELRERLNQIDTDGVLDGGIVEQFIEDRWLSPFPQFLFTERPDRAVSSLLEGQALIIVAGSSQVLVAPATLNTLMLAGDDYYERWIPGTALRILRFFGSLLALFLPSIYIAALSFHPGFLPTTFLLSTVATRAGVPFGVWVEALLLELSLELLREAALRLPKPLAQTIGVVGGIVIGQAAVTAGIVGAAMVIIVATTAIGTFALPNTALSYAVRILRFPLILTSSIFGVYGVIMGGLAILVHLASLESFGVSYLSPWAPFDLTGLKDSVIRIPTFFMRSRPKSNRPKDIERR